MLTDLMRNITVTARMKFMKQTQRTLLPGETPMPEAPLINVDHDFACIPQHYLMFNHDQHSVESILLDIQYDDHYLLFVNEAADGPIIQVGIVGKDNYVIPASQPGNKIVYGRKWRIERQLPTSEVIQTAFLALIKAREHEIRERFKLCTEGKITTPFSGHHDLPLMASRNLNTVRHTDVSQSVRARLERLLSRITFDHGQFKISAFEQRQNNGWLFDLDYQPSENSQLPESTPKSFTLVLNRPDDDELLYTLMDYLLKSSERHVEEHFTYKGYPRFSRENRVEDISALSAMTRQANNNVTANHFMSSFKQANYETDLTRVPTLGNTALSVKIHKTLIKLNVVDGILPHSTR